MSPPSQKLASLPAWQMETFWVEVAFQVQMILLEMNPRWLLSYLQKRSGGWSLSSLPPEY